jgi:pyruvate dehydrogenase E2 component (dihydrolipoamide acetyltransferase)
MATEVKLPRLGQGMESGTIVRWLKSEGDAVAKREPLYELDTDKVTQEVEAEADGVLLKILVPEGEVEVGATVAVIGKEGEEVSIEAVTAKPAPAAEPPPAEPPSAEAPPAPEPATPSPGGSEPRSGETPSATPPATAPASAPAGNGRVKASPLARRMARERGIDLTGIAGTGPDGRIVAEDVEKAASGSGPAPTAPVSAAPPAREVEVVALTSTRRTIARRLTEAWQAPVFQLGVSADMTEVLALREKLVEWAGEGDVKPTVNDVLTKLVGVALGRHRAVNATFDGEQITRFSAAHVGMAVAAPNGLVVPVIRDADRRTIREIARARADVVGRARDGRLALEDMQGGTFTVSNLGMFGVDEFVAVLNPPQVAILAVGTVKETPVVVDGDVDVAPVVQIGLTSDHRAIDGADGARFLQTLVALIEQPGLAL